VLSDEQNDGGDGDFNETSSSWAVMLSWLENTSHPLFGGQF